MVVETRGRGARRLGPLREEVLNPIGEDGSLRLEAFQRIAHNQISHTVMGDIRAPMQEGVSIDWEEDEEPVWEEDEEPVENTQSTRRAFS